MDIAALKASALKATPGPWRVDPSYCVYAGEPEHGTRQDVADNAWHNAEHIARANPTSILSMIARLEALEEALIAAQEVVNVAEKMTSCRGDDDWIWGVQDQIKAALEPTR